METEAINYSEGLQMSLLILSDLARRVEKPVFWRLL